MTTTADYGWRSEMFRDLTASAHKKGEAEGEARGEAYGKAQAILTVLDGRGIVVPVEVRERVLACADVSRLDIWLRRAVTAGDVHEVVGE